MQDLNFQRGKVLVPDRHGASSWKRWIFCPTDHLDFENLENRRRYHNPTKPRTAGLCGREVVASDHLPLSSTFFGRPKSPDLPPKTAAVVPLPMLFSFWRYPRKTSSQTSAHTGRTRPAVSLASADATSLALGAHSLSQVATEGFLVPAARLLLNFRRLPILFTAAQILSFWGYEKPDPHDDPHCGAVEEKLRERHSEKVS